MEKIKIIVVDDNVNELNLIKLYLQNVNEFNIVLFTNSAEEAIKFLEENTVDLIVTDIEMPYIDGIEFSKIVRELYSYIKIVFLTGHEKFEYAQQAIRIKVMDYITKPIIKSVFIERIKNIANDIVEEKSRMIRYRKFSQIYDNINSYLKEKFLNKVLAGKNDDFDNFSLNNFFDFVQIGIVKIAISSIYNSLNKNNSLTTNCTLLIKEYFNGINNLDVFTDVYHDIVILSNNRILNLETDCKHILKRIVSLFNINISIGISKIHKNKYEIQTAYKEAKEAIKYNEIKEIYDICLYNDLHINNDKLCSFSEITEFGTLVKAGNRKRVAELLDKIFNDLYNRSSLTIQDLHLTAINIIGYIHITINDLGIDFNKIITNYTFSEIFQLKSLPEIKKFLEKSLESIISKVLENQKKLSNKKVEEIKNCIEKNLNNPNLSLSYISAELYNNESYLARVFKDKIGMSIHVYVTEKRMDIARYYLKKTPSRVNEVARICGFNDSLYFSRIFKKYNYGISPTEYRNNE